MSKEIKIARRFSQKFIKSDNPNITVVMAGGGGGSNPDPGMDPAQVVSIVNTDPTINAYNAARLGGNLPSHFEPAFTKNTAFNKNFGTTSGTVAQGNHTHNGVIRLKGEEVDSGQLINQGGDVIFEAGNNVTVQRTSNKIRITANVPENNAIHTINESNGIEVTGTGTSRTIAARLGDTMRFNPVNDKMVIDVDPNFVGMKAQANTWTGANSFTQAVQSAVGFDIGTNRVINSNRTVKANASNTPATPAYTFEGDENTGMYRAAAGIIAFSQSGTVRFRMNAGNFQVGTTTVITSGRLVQAAAGAVGGVGLAVGATNTGFYRSTTTRIDTSISGSRRASQIGDDFHVKGDIVAYSSEV